MARASWHAGKDGPLLAAGFAQERLNELQPADATPQDLPG
jgi:hypothetical protein